MRNTPKNMRKKANKLKGFVSEQYAIKYNIEKDDGYWIYGAKEDVEILSPYENEKNNHVQAEYEFMKLNPKAQIVSVIYC